MAREGQHQAQVEIKGSSKSASKESAALTKRIHDLETQLGKTQERLDTYADKLKKKEGASKKASGAAAILQGALEKVGHAGIEFAEGALQQVIQGMVAATQETIRNARELTTWSAILGEGTDELQRFQKAVFVAGGDVEGANDAIQTFRENLGEMQRLGTGPAVDALATLGIELEDIIGLPLDRQMEVFADGLQTLGTDAEKVSVTLEVMGDEGGRSLLPFLKKGTLGMRELGAEAERSGSIMDREMIAQMKALDEETRKLELRLDGLTQQIVSATVPAFNDAIERVDILVQALDDAVEAGGDLVAEFETLQETTDELKGATEESTEAVEENEGSWLGLLAVMTPVGQGFFALIAIVREVTDEVRTMGGAIAVARARALGEVQSRIAEAAAQEGAILQQERAAQRATDAFTKMADAVGDALSAGAQKIPGVGFDIRTPKKPRKRKKRAVDMSEFEDFDAMDITGQRAADTVAFRQELATAKMEESFSRLAELRREDIVSLREYARAKEDLEIEKRLFDVDADAASGEISELERISLVRDAQLDRLDIEREVASEIQDVRLRELEMERIAHEERRLYHEAALAREEELRKAKLKTWKTVVQATEATSQVLMGGAQTAQMATDLFIQGDQRAEKAKYTIAATEAFIVGAVQQVKAIAAFASFNYVQGALHQAAAIFAFAQGGMLAAKAGGAGSTAGLTNSVSTTSGAASTGSSGGSQRSGGEGLQNQIDSDVPPSQAPTSQGPRSGRDRRQEGGFTNQGTIHLYGTPTDELVDSLALALEQRQYNRRRAS